MMVDQNLFIEGVLPALIVRQMSKAEHDAYRAPWADPAARKILCKFPQNLCIGGEPKSINDMQQAYMNWLQECDTPKLLLWAEPGVLIGRETAEWCGEHLPNCRVESVGKGLHYIQEDCPAEIGAAISTWMAAM
jgi:haloalkane dehalogenase